MVARFCFILENEAQEVLMAQGYRVEILKKSVDRHGLPFARRWLGERKKDLALPALVRSRVLHVYPVLSDIPGSLVSQTEHTVIVTSDGCVVTTR